jgi:hypothetical protein
MDTDRFAQLSRLLSRALPNRRAVLIGLLGSGAVATAADEGDAASKAQKRRRRRRRRNRNDTVPPPPPPPPFVCPAAEVCGPGCCTSDRCYVSKVDGDTGQPLDVFCCPAELVCKSQLVNFRDQCCYPDETCNPNLPNEEPEVNSICCRPCGGRCLPSNEECVGGEGVPQQTARSPRYRR